MSSGDRTRQYYRYYDTPDGCDMVKKAIVTTRYGVITGLFLSTFDVLMYSHAMGIKNVLRRYQYHTVPLALMGATFAVVANTMANVREKDDKLNYVAGALASAPILGFYVGSMHGWFVGSVALSIIAAFKKDSVDDGWVFFPDVKHQSYNLFSNRHDFTLATDPRDEKRRVCHATNAHE